MKKILNLLVFCLLSTNIFSQWVQNNISGNTQDLYSVDYRSLDTIWVGSYLKMYTSGNGGTSWNLKSPIQDVNNIGITPANLNDLAITGYNKGIATGVFYTGNNELILTTNNGGTSWTMATNNNSLPLLRYINSVDVLGNNAVAVGSNGRIAISNNLGASWTFVSSGITTALEWVEYVSPDTIIAIGPNRILRSVNAGLTWSSLSSSGSYSKITSVDGVVYISVGGTNTLLKSSDGGTTFTTVPAPPLYNGSIYAISADTLVAGGADIFISKNGGQLWEQCSLTGVTNITMFDFYDSNHGIVVGTSGYVARTTNFSQVASYPIVNFNIVGGTHCLNDSVLFTNTCANNAGYTFDWKLDGVSFANTYNAGINVTTSGTHTVTLTVSNVSGSTTKSATFSVTGHPAISLNASVEKDTLCSNSKVGFIINNSTSGTTYYLRQNYTTIGSSQNGNGNNLYFRSPSALLNSVTYNILAKATNACFVDSLNYTKDIYVYPLQVQPIYACVPSIGACTNEGINNVSFADIIHTSNDNFVSSYRNFTCCQNANVVQGNTYPISITSQVSSGANSQYVSVWIDYNNDGAFTYPTERIFVGQAAPTFTTNITIDTTQFYNQKLRMRVFTDYLSPNMTNACSASNCGQIEDYSITIAPSAQLPISAFTKVVTASCSTTVATTNTSYNATQYIWDFGDGSPQINTMNASHIYTTSGTYPLRLITCNPTGCDTTTELITITIPLLPRAQTCNLIMNTTGIVTGIYSLSIDTVGNNVNGAFYRYIRSTASYPPECNSQIHLKAGKSYYFFSQVDLSGSTSRGNLVGFIDYNNDGFLSNNENMGDNGPYLRGSGGSPTWLPIDTFRVPFAAVLNTPLKLRLIAYDEINNTIYDGCNSNAFWYPYGKTVDFTVFIEPPTPPVVGFYNALSNTCTNDSARFVNTTMYAESYLWDFGDGSTSILREPKHLYTTPGVYDVKLIAYNSLGSDTVFYPNYITIHQALPSPVITLNNNQLSTGAIANTTYNWYYNSSYINGATTNVINVGQQGNYQVKIINQNNCISPSAIFPYFPPHVSFSADTLGYCGVNNADVQFTNTCLNSTNFTWYFGDGQTSTLANPSHYYAAPGTYSVKLVASSNIGLLDSLILPNYIFIDNQNFSASLNVSGTINTCYLDTFYIRCSDSSQFTTYQWYESGFPLMGDTLYKLNANYDGDFTCLVTNQYGCQGITNNVVLSINYDCVWPGDADNNWIADNYDLLAIGLNYGQTGLARASNTIDWLPQEMTWWGISSPNFFYDLKHTDCNGDGIIDMNDTVAISTNFGNLVGQPNTNRTANLFLVNTPISLNSSSTIYNNGDTVRIDVQLGNSQLFETAIYGLAYNVAINGNYIYPNSLSISYPASWFGSPLVDAINLSKISASQDMIQTALTKIDNIDVGGFGNIATIKFVAENHTGTSQPMQFQINSVYANNSFGDEIFIDASDINFTVLSSPVGMETANKNASLLFSVSPNPIQDNTHIDFYLNEKSAVSIEITSANGSSISCLTNKNLDEGVHSIEIDEQVKLLPAGIYFVKLTCNNVTSCKRIVKIK